MRSEDEEFEFNLREYLHDLEKAIIVCRSGINPYNQEPLVQPYIVRRSYKVNGKEHVFYSEVKFE